MAWTKWGHRPKMIQVTCQCGCNEIFGAIVTSNRPKYKNKTHQMRAYRRRVREAKQKKNNEVAPDGANLTARWTSSIPQSKSICNTSLLVGGRGVGYGKGGEGPVTPLPDYDSMLRWYQDRNEATRNQLARMFVW